MPRKISKEDFIIKSNEIDKKLLTNSFNYFSTFSKKTKLLIVGTLTPPDVPYFYCSKHNRIYGYLDKALFMANDGYEPILKSLKNKIIKSGNNKFIVDKAIKSIKKVLKEYNIAFLDVMDEAIRKKVSSYDNDIKYYTLAYKYFQNIKQDVKIIANSALAKKCLEKIGLINFEYISQRCDRKEKWINYLYNVLKEKKQSKNEKKSKVNIDKKAKCLKILMR